MQVKDLLSRLQQRFGDILLDARLVTNEVTVEIAPQDVLDSFTALRDESEFSFDQLIDVCGVDYSEYGSSEWATDETSSTGFSRGVKPGVNGLPRRRPLGRAPESRPKATWFDMLQ